MNSSKLQLSAEELAMVQDSHWLLTKNSIMQKANELFGDCATWLRSSLRGQFADEAVLFNSPKIARGENYDGLPYVMLDYPRLFGKENIFAFRTMFWWGNFLSVTWHLKGQYAASYRASIMAAFDRLGSAGFRICIGEDEWRHDFSAANYRNINELTLQQFSATLSEKPFVKLAVSIPLEKWNNAQNELTECYSLLLSVAHVSYPGDGTNL